MARKETWVLVADAAGARVLRYAETRRLDLLRTYPHEEARAKPSDLVVDWPGRSFDSSRTGGRHAMEPDTDVKRAELRRFVHELARELDEAALTNRFDDLVVVAGPRLMGELRRALPDQVTVRIRHEIGKDLASLDVPQLTTEVGRVLWH